ncbi:hypothetical protein ACF0H5_017549 [Mactra antiquata]
MSSLSLGVDLGTTSVKVSLVDILSKSLIFCTSEPTNSDINKEDIQGFEQDVSKIFDAVVSCLIRITDKNRSLIKCISISGQMHGVLLWNSQNQSGLGENTITASNNSNLYTWQDKRATAEFLASLPKPDSHQNVSTGFGCVTLFWLQRFDQEKLVLYDVVGGIMDYLVMLLCGLECPVMSHQIATSWGYFCSEKMSWNTEILQEANFPVHLLPHVTEAGNQAGTLCKDWLGISKGTPVLVGLGDLQCSFVSASKNNHDAVMNISTSGQLCYPISIPDFIPPRFPVPCPVSYFPFFNNTYLAVAASLNGGNVLSAFVKMLQDWFSTFGFTLDKETIWKKLTEMSTSNEGDSGANGGMIIQPVLYGERHDPSLTGSLSGANLYNTSLDCVFKSVCEGLVHNLYQMMPLSKLIESGITRLVLTGSVVDKQPYVKECVRRSYSPLEVVDGIGADSAFGAALVACRFIEASSK